MIFSRGKGKFTLAKAAANEKSQLKVVMGKEKEVIKDSCVVLTKRSRLKQKHWYNKKIKLWQAILMSLAALSVIWKVNYVNIYCKYYLLIKTLICGKILIVASAVTVVKNGS